MTVKCSYTCPDCEHSWTKVHTDGPEPDDCAQCACIVDPHEDYETINEDEPDEQS